MNKNVFITGGTRGIGKATVELFASKGFNVAFTYINSQNIAKQMEKELSIKYPNSIFQSFKANVASYEGMQDVAKKILSTFGKIDVIVANAGISKIAPFIDLTKQDYDEMLGINLKGVFNTIKPFLPSMIEQKNGKIVIVSSIWGLNGSSCESLYCASKAGQIGLMKSLAKELGPSNINVNCVCPGLIDTDMNSELSKEDKMQIIEETPMNRIGTPSDVANAIYFLSSDNATFITGQTLTVDGGWIN
ncbi:MAG: 3-oxoacyl-ACP reductase FabG [Firmicutes bacterium]|nr:3-oxoacyl-ACP reductase FabG [Bacillota bacterium]